MILFMKITIIYKIENFLLINVGAKSIVSNKKVLYDSPHMVHKTKMVLYSIKIDLPLVWQSELIVELICFSKRSVRASHITFIIKKFENNVISVAWDNISYVRSSAKGVFQPSLHLQTYSEVSKLSLYEKLIKQSFFTIFLKNP